MTPAYANQTGFVRLTNGHELYAEYQEPRNPKAKTLVVLNGLDYDVRAWDRFVDELKQLSPEIGLLRFDFRGQGETLKKEGGVSQDIPYQEQVIDLGLLLEALSIKGKIALLGFSYGGGIATAFAATKPNAIDTLILLAPFTEYDRKGDHWLKAQTATTRLMFPWLPMSNEAIYDFYFRNLVFNIFPAIAPELKDTPHKLKAIYHLIRGIRSLDARPLLARLPIGSLNLLIASEDRLVGRETLLSFWESAPEKIRARKVEIAGARHKVPELQPRELAQVIHGITSEVRVHDCEHHLVGSSRQDLSGLRE